MKLTASSAALVRFEKLEPRPTPALVKRSVNRLMPTSQPPAATTTKFVPPAKPAKPAQPPLSDEARAKIAARTARNRELAALLREMFPAVFCRPRKPLAIGVDKRIIETLGDRIAAADLRPFLAWWCRQPDYLDAIARLEPRRNLDGTEAGFPTAEQQKHAAERVYGAQAEAMLARIAACQAEQVPP